MGLLKRLQNQPMDSSFNEKVQETKFPTFFQETQNSPNSSLEPLGMPWTSVKLPCNWIKRIALQVLI